MAGQQVRVGFVGCGVHAREVLLPAAQRAGMELAAVCDLDKRLAQRVTRRFGAFRAYQDVGRMVDEMDLDAAIVCGPPEMHAEAAQTALREGVHVWTEMPAAPTSEEATRLATMARERDLVAQPGLVMRFAPACRRLREICTAEDFGEVRSIEVAWWPPERHGHDEPLSFDLPHALDLVRYIDGDIRRLSVARGSDEKTFMVSMELASGAVAAISFHAPAGCPRERVTVAGAGAVVSAENRRTVTVRRCGVDEMSVWDAAQVGGAGSERIQGFLSELEHFVAAVGGGEPLATMNDAAEALRLAERVGGNTGEMMDMG